MSQPKLHEIKLKKHAYIKDYWVHKNDSKPEKIANSNDFVFDRKNLKIIKKGQMELL